jgi:site-specific DNA-cytosine methylase
VCWNPAPRRKKGQATAADAGAGVEAGLPRTVGTLCADAHPGAYSGQDAYTGRLIPHEQPVVIDRAAFNQGENAQYEPHIEQTDVMDSLVARGPHAVGVPFRKSKRAQSTTDDESLVVADASNTLNNFDLGDTRTTHAVVDAITFQPGNLRREAGAEPSTTTTLKASMGDQMPHVATAMAVRRLTPVECERLQGFPDNWSQIPWKGKPADQCPDGPRYKCAGNSMAVPCMRWIGEQIARVELSTQQPK